MQEICFLGLVPHEDNLHQCRHDEPQAVEDVQPFETDCVLDPRLYVLIGFHPEEHLDTYASDHQEGCSNNLSDNSNSWKCLVPIEQ